VANKVQTLEGRWLSIDGRVLFKANVAASETYNTALEQHLRDTLGVRFAERPGTDPAKRPIREIVGVDPRLNQRWSTRRVHIEARRGSWPSSSSMIMADRRPQWKRCTWHTRRPWRPATPSTNPDP
jgi:TrwC relaxase